MRDETSTDIQLLLAQRGVATFDWDVESDRLYGGERLASLFGLAPGPLSQGITLDQLLDRIHPDDVPFVKTSIGRAVDGSAPYRTAYRVQRPDGGFRGVVASGRCQLEPEDGRRHFTGIVIESSAGPRATESEQRVALDAITDFILSAYSLVRSIDDPILDALIVLTLTHLGLRPIMDAAAARNRQAAERRSDDIRLSHRAGSDGDGRLDDEG